MRYFFYGLLAAFGAQLRNAKTWIVLLLMPLVIWGISAALPPQELMAPVQVGVAFPEEGGEAFRQALMERSGTVVTFIPADEQTIIGNVSTAKWDCGLVLRQDFDARISQLETDSLIRVYVSEGSAAYPLVMETAAACLAKTASPEIAEQYLQQNDIPVQELPFDQTVQGLEVVMTTSDGSALDAVSLSGDTSARVLYGIVAILLLVWCLLASGDLGRWCGSGAALRLRAVRGVTAVLLPRGAAALLPVWIVTGAALALARGSLMPLVSLGAYLMLLGTGMLLAARYKPVWAAMPVVMPFVPVVCLLLSPVVFDVSMWLPGLRGISSVMPVTMYLRACEGGVGEIWKMLAAAAVLGALSLLADRFGKMKKRVEDKR